MGLFLYLLQIIHAMKQSFKNLPELLNYFKEQKTCIEFLEQQRWGGKPVCTHCGHSEKIYRTNRGYKCPKCLKKFSVTVGTVLEKTHIALNIWFGAIYICTAHKKGISSLQLSRDLGITQKTAWYLLHRIREMMKEKAPQMLEGTVEVDETYIGGNYRNKHKSERNQLQESGKKILGRGTDKPTVLGLVQRDGSIVHQPVESAMRKDVFPIIQKHVKEGSTVITDEFGTYKTVPKMGYKHETVAHKFDEYVRDGFHTNTIEGAFGLFKRGIVGIYHSISRKHLHRYCNEFAYRYNTRKSSDMNRFAVSLTRVDGKRLTYKNLIQKNAG